MIQAGVVCTDCYVCTESTISDTYYGEVEFCLLVVCHDDSET